MDLNANTQELHLSHYWNVIVKRWKVAISILVVVIVGTLLASYFSKPLYRSAIRIQIERENPQQVTIEDLFGIQASDQEFLQTQYELLKSRGLGAKVIDDQKLLSDPEFYPGGVATKTPKEKEAIRDAMSGAIIGSTIVEPVRGTSLVDISYIAGSPRLAQKIAQGIGLSYIRLTSEQKFQRVKEASDFLSQKIRQLREDIDNERLQLRQFSELKGIVSVGGADTITSQNLLKMTQDVNSARAERISKQAAYQTIVSSSPDSVGATDTLVRQLLEEETKYQRDYNQKRAVLLPEHPTMQALKQQIDKTAQARQKATLDAYAKAKEAAHNELNNAETRLSQLENAQGHLESESFGMTANASTASDLQTSISRKETLLDQLQKRLNETEIGWRTGSNIHLIDNAELPTGRFNESMKKNLQQAFPLGLILGLAAIFFLEYMDRSIKSPEELERVTHFASLGVIPNANSAGRGYGYGYGSKANLRAVEMPPANASGGIDLLPHIDSRSPISEAYRAFRTSLLLASANSPKVIVITSTFAREGKTTTSVNLATVLAQMGKPVLLIDADLRRPRLQKIFRGKMNLGLVNYLAANVPVDDVIQETIVPHLSVVLSGPTPPNPSELLASDKMKHLIHEIRGKFAYIIFDSPPVLAVTDSIVLAASADGVVLCVHGGQTPRELVLRSAERLRQSNIPVLGAILNNLDLQQYGYSFKKSYYDYYDNESNDKEAAPRTASRA